MSDEIVVYLSKSGFTETYARWIAEDLECECVPYSSIDRATLEKYKRVVVGSYVRFEKMSHIKEVAALVNGLPDATLFIVGAAPMTDRIAVGKMLSRTLKACPKLIYYPRFYFQGGIRMSRLDWWERLLLRFFAICIKILPLNKDMKGAALRIAHSADNSNRANICALVEYVKSRRSANAGSPGEQGE